MEIRCRNLDRCKLRRASALVARRAAQQSLPDDSAGTLAANLIGGYIIGLAIALFSSDTALSLEWRLFIVTGFCGGLTTFSTFSAELVTLMQQERLLATCAAAAAHLAGSVIMTFAGIGTIAWVKS